MDDDRVIAVGLLTKRDLDLLGPTFTRVWPVDPAPCFDDLLQAIDRADQRLSEGQPPRADRSITS